MSPVQSSPVHLSPVISYTQSSMQHIKVKENK